MQMYIQRCILFAPLLLFVLPSNGLDCGDGKIRGVNLGGWLLLEPWITPVIFQEVNVGANEGLIVDEWTYAQYVDTAYASQRLDTHWDTFYTKYDLQTLFDSGISHLRIPVGYWLVDVNPDEPFPSPPATDNDGMRFYLKRLVGWCNDIGLKVLLDLHGCPGSQNGQDHSGRRGDILWYTEDGNHSNVDRTIIVLEKLSDMFITWFNEGTITADVLYGIELANQPAGNLDYIWYEVRDHFNYDGYDALRGKFPDPESLTVVIQQSARNGTDYYGYMSEAEGYEKVDLDMHVYRAFGDYWNGMAEQADNWEVHLNMSCAYSNEVAGQTLPTYTGEWSLAITDCQKYIGEGYGDPYTPIASNATCTYYNSDFDTYPIEYRIFLGDYAMAQMDSHETGKGWFFWTAKTENNCAPEWDYLFLLENGIMPTNLCQRPTYCN